ncbi:MAG: methyltransferase domain-containing protein [Candidatus Aminicenantes bacterium]|nr:methyltransferase domain-containing protein [Candidatus Aminicenantes bacterium]
MKREQKDFEHFNKCPVCTSPSLASFKKSTFDFLRLSQDEIKITDSDYGKIWDLSRCQDCSHIFANPSPSPEFISTLYSEVEDPLYEEEARGRSKSFIKILNRLERIQPSRGTLFDVGAATGILLNLARQRGWEVDGIETSSWAVKLAEQKYNIQLRQGSFEEIELKKNLYAAVTMIDFIEHTPRPFQALIKAHEMLSSDGILVLVTPDVASLAAKIAGQRWWHFRAGHLAFFNKRSLHALLQRSSFQVIKERKYAWTFSAYYLMSRKRWLRFLLKNPLLASFWKKIQLKLALGDSFEIYARKEEKP